LRYNVRRNRCCAKKLKGDIVEEEQQGCSNALVLAVPLSAVGCVIVLVALLIIGILLLPAFL
jgi:hypothetical protein